MSDQNLIEMAKAIGRIEGKLDGLCGPEGRVTKLEAAQTRQWWMAFVVTPIMLLAQAFARKLGVQI